ncbi:MAG: hypothetical protein DWQ02_13110 [Bacteroidetes bacterium]|nr:MAG: hypothetical protein DWQ02_13110 [Bacteroidota bacterium]
MAPLKKKYSTVDEYIADFPSSVQSILQRMRHTIHKAAPKAEEVISYNMPAIKLNGMLVYYAAYERHIGFYPTASGISAFEKELSGYKQGKGSVQFKLDEEIPYDLVQRIVEFRVEEQLSGKVKKKR